MKRAMLLATLITLAAATGGMGQEAEEKPPASVGTGAGGWPQLESEAIIRRLYDDFQSAWNAHDAQAMAKFWAPAGDHYQPDGRFAEGRPAIEAMFSKEQAGPYRESELDLTIRSVWMITPNVALVNGNYAVHDVLDHEGNKIQLRQGVLTSVLLREGGEWRIAASRAMIPVPLPY